MVALLVGCWTYDLQVAGSSPVPLRSGLGLATYGKLALYTQQTYVGVGLGLGLVESVGLGLVLGL